MIYQYHYTDSCGKRHAIYAPTLEELRKKEAEINRTDIDSASYASYHDGGITVVELLERYISLKQGVRYARLQLCFEPCQKGGLRAKMHPRHQSL